MSSEVPAASGPAASPPASPSGPRPRLNITDPTAMRALAHPVRAALLELFSVSPTLTATQASEALGESPANCAFHLRTLAKYGFLEEAGGGRGRERPWRRAHAGLNLPGGRELEPRARLAAEALGSMWRERWLGRIRRAFAARAWTGEWEKGVTASNAVRFLTAAEAAEVVAELQKIADRYRDRTDDPALRPEGALPVEITVFCYPFADQAALAPGADDTGDIGDLPLGPTRNVEGERCRAPRHRHLPGPVPP